MSAQIIDPKRYKKTTKKEIEKKKKVNSYTSDKKFKNEKNIKFKKSNNTYNNLNRVDKKSSVNLKNKKIKNKENSNSKKKKKLIYIPKLFKICVVVILIIAIGFISKKIVKFENMPLISAFSNKEKDIQLKSNYNLKLGISKLDTTDALNSKNIILNELNNNASLKFVNINNDYSLDYIVATKIEKINNKEYMVYLNKEYNLKFNDIENAINKIKNYPSSPYFKNVNIIEKIEDKGESIKFNLKEDSPYFVYMLDFPLNIENERLEYYLNAKSDTTINYIKRASISTISSIELNNYNDTDKMVEDFRNDNLDVFFTSSDIVMQLIGKHDYNVKKYRDGETLFLLGNTSSKIFKLKEVRKALAYSLNRDEIVKKTNKSFSEVIDLPYIYSNISYKYDIYGAENELLSNGYTKIDGVYTKQLENEQIKLELNMIVNEEDNIKKEVAQYIREMTEKIGIKINVNVLSKYDYEEKVKNKEYDIILANVYINQNPDISYLYEYINVNDTVNNAINKVINSASVEEVITNVQEMQSILSQEIACIGISAKNTNVVYQKYIAGFDSLNYLKIFEKVENIGRIKED